MSGDKFSKRSYVVIGIFAFVVLAYSVKLFGLQVLNPGYKQFATNNVLREIVQYPARGLVYDRNGKLLVYNKAAYDLLVTPREVKPFDTLLLCTILEIEKEDLVRRMKEASRYSRYKPSILVKQISPETYAVLQEKLYKFKGFHTQSRTLREYNYASAAHLLGYVGEVTRANIDADSYYASGDYIGIDGIEKSYEKQLRGEKGIKKYLVDVHNRIKGSYVEGLEDKPAQIGQNVTSTINVDLQLYAEQLLQNKKGSVVAIEPSTGEILALVSAPGYDPGLLVGRIRGKNFSLLMADTLKPLFNRALMAKYPPGSTFKVFNVLVALQTGAITMGTHYSCAGPGSLPIKCTHNHSSPLNLEEAIRESCNPFMWNTFKAIINTEKTTADGFKTWQEYADKFGFGKKLDTDLTIENKGNVPTVDFYDRIYGKRRWSSLTVRSLSIGQGELGITPLQLANYCAIMANRGHYYIPHIVKDIENDEIDKRFYEKHNVDIDAEHFEHAVYGMQMAVEHNSYGSMLKIPGVTICGKTGTAENPHGSDHSVFMAFAPKDDPKIAISVYIENGVWGARYAAPIAGLLIEKYLTDSIATSKKWVEERMINANLLNPNQPK